MNEPRNNGGAAFPHASVAEWQTGIHKPAERGMTLRDYFAAKALKGFLERGVLGDIMRQYGIDEDAAQAKLAEGCYVVADAMLKERAK